MRPTQVLDVNLDPTLIQGLHALGGQGKRGIPLCSILRLGGGRPEAEQECDGEDILPAVQEIRARLRSG